MPLLTAHGAYIRWFAELDLDDIPLGRNVLGRRNINWSTMSVAGR